MLCDGCWITCSVSKNWPFNLNLNSGEVRSENFVLFATQNLCVLDQSCWHCSSSFHQTLVSKTSKSYKGSSVWLCWMNLWYTLLMSEKNPNISLLLIMLLLPSVLDAADSFSEECCLVSGSWPQTQFLLPVRKNIRSVRNRSWYLLVEMIRIGLPWLKTNRTAKGGDQGVDLEGESRQI